MGKSDFLTLPARVIEKMVSYFNADVKRINHALKVYGFAQAIGKLEKLSDDDLVVLEIAAILHDIGIKESEKKYNSSAGNYQEIEGPQIAEELLSEFNLANKFVDRIKFLIGNHHTYSKIDNIDFQILVEADILVNIKEDHCDPGIIQSYREKHFKTQSGKSFIKQMYM